MARYKKEVAEARNGFLDEWSRLADLTVSNRETFKKLITKPEINCGKEFEDRYIETSIKVENIYREVEKLLRKNQLTKAQDKAFEACLYQENILDKYADFFREHAVKAK